MPDKFTAGAQIYADANLQNVLAVVSDVRDPITGNYSGTPYAVYNARPLLHAESTHPVFSSVSEFSRSQVLVKYDEALAALHEPLYNAPEVAFPNNPYG